MLNILPNHSLKELNTWLVGGNAEFYCEPESVEDLREAMAWSRTKSISPVILGSGSNVLVSDGGVAGLVISTKKLNKISSSLIGNNLVIEAQTGVPKMELLKLYLKYELAPALFLAGIPGTVGGGIVMNAGVGEAFVPREFCEIVSKVSVLRGDGQIDEIPTEKLNWFYRHCNGWQPGILIAATIVWPRLAQPGIREKVRQANQTRLQKQPLDMPSCGSVFRNPKNYKAAQLIDECGLRGFAIGDACVSSKHANFIVNRGNARAEEISDLILHVQKVVLEKKQIQLETEVVSLS